MNTSKNTEKTEIAKSVQTLPEVEGTDKTMFGYCPTMENMREAHEMEGNGFVAESIGPQPAMQSVPVSTPKASPIPTKAISGFCNRNHLRCDLPVATTPIDAASRIAFETMPTSAATSYTSTSWASSVGRSVLYMVLLPIHVLITLIACLLNTCLLNTCYRIMLDLKFNAQDNFYRELLLVQQLKSTHQVRDHTDRNSPFPRYGIHVLSRDDLLQARDRTWLPRPSSSTTADSRTGAWPHHLLTRILRQCLLILTRNSIVVGLLAFCSRFSYGSAASDVALAALPPFSTPLTPAQYIPIFCLTVAFTSIFGTSIHQFEAWTEQFGLAAFVGLLASILEMDKRDGQEKWLLLLLGIFTIAATVMSLLGLWRQSRNASFGPVDIERDSAQFRTNDKDYQDDDGRCPNCGKTECDGCGSGASSGNEDQI